MLSLSSCDMEEYQELLDESLSHACGWCGKDSWFKLRCAAITGSVWSYGPGGGDTRPLLAAIYQCAGCERPTLLVYEVLTSTYGGSLSIHASFPTGRAPRRGHLPESIERDRAEAWNCHYAGLNRAAILMARSALQRAVRHLSTFRGTLNTELDNLVSEGVITQQLRQNANEVRLSGNDVAHPEELTDVSESDAKDSLVFMDDFLETTIEIPLRQAKRKSARESRSKPQE